jgi:cytochrome o ubiquinol oxidase subunit II
MLARMRITLSREFLLKFAFILFACLLMVALSGCKNSVGMLNPKGTVAYQERKLFFDTLALMLIVVLPVIVMSFTFIFHYQHSHRISDYKPNWGHNLFLESIWWGIPCAIIFVMAVITWQKTHELDPFNPIPGHAGQTLRIHAIALPWKWLFIYPDQQIASLNYLEIPMGQQIEFWITADNTPMSAIFIPQLGSQIYAMAGMRTRLYLYANEVGMYEGMNTQFSGDGFSEMHFPVQVVEATSFDQWVAQVKKSPLQLQENQYEALLQPTIKSSAQFYSQVDTTIFNHALQIYMNTFGTIHPRSKE